ncbi:DUF5658 family protein [Natronomonas aquatica]|uniref:DUF5658 family protein n=1 Tax=Natronomonas aquatica TaxID=2841590 RepID=UPI00210A085D
MNDERAVPVVGGNDRWVWIAALLLYGVGDTVTTLWGLSTGGVTEAGPVAKPLIAAYGHAAILGIKTVVFPSFYLVWRALRTPGRIAVPFALAVVGAVVTAWNLLVIVGAP